MCGDNDDDEDFGAVEAAAAADVEVDADLSDNLMLIGFDDCTAGAGDIKLSEDEAATECRGFFEKDGDSVECSLSLNLITLDFEDCLDLEPDSDAAKAAALERAFFAAALAALALARIFALAASSSSASTQHMPLRGSVCIKQ